MEKAIGKKANVKYKRFGLLEIGYRKRERSLFYDEKVAKAVNEIREYMFQKFKPLLNWLANKLRKRERYAVAYCPTCKRKIPVNFSEAIKEDIPDLKATIAYCVVCEEVLNYDEDIKIKWVTKGWLKRHRWTPSESEDA